MLVYHITSSTAQQPTANTAAEPTITVHVEIRDESAPAPVLIEARDLSFPWNATLTECEAQCAAFRDEVQTRQEHYAHAQETAAALMGRSG